MLCCAVLCLQVVQFATNVTSIDTQRLPYKLNSLLPHDIRVCWMSQTAPDFSVTVSAKHKVRLAGHRLSKKQGEAGC